MINLDACRISGSSADAQVTHAPLLQRPRPRQTALQEDAIREDRVEGRRPVERGEPGDESRAVGGGTGDDGRGRERVIGVSVDYQGPQDAVIKAETGILIDDELRLQEGKAESRVEASPVRNDAVRRRVGVGDTAAQRILIFQTEPVVSTDRHRPGQRAAVISTEAHVARTELGDASRGDRAVELSDEISRIRTVDDQLAWNGNRNRVGLGRRVIKDKTSARQRDREAGRDGKPRDGPGGLIRNRDRIRPHRRDDSPGRNASPRHGLTHAKVGRGDVGDDVGASGSIASDSRCRGGGQRNIPESQGVNVRIVRKRARGGHVDSRRSAGQAGGDAGTGAAVGHLAGARSRGQYRL